MSYPPVSLRDWFAGQALAGLSLDFYKVWGDAESGEYGDNTQQEIVNISKQLAEMSYALADAMLKERSRK